MSNGNSTSTAQSYLDSAVGTVQSALGSLTGHTADEQAGQARQQEAQREYDASHAAAKGPGFTVTASGGVAKDDPNRSTGSWQQTVGSAKETVGGLIGSESLKQSGREQNLAGREQEARGQANDLVTGAGERVKGTVGGAFAGLTGNTQAEADFQRQREQGKAQQRGAEHDIQKQADTQRQ